VAESSRNIRPPPRMDVSGPRGRYRREPLASSPERSERRTKFSGFRRGAVPFGEAFAVPSFGRDRVPSSILPGTTPVISQVPRAHLGRETEHEAHCLPCRVHLSDPTGPRGVRARSPGGRPAPYLVGGR